MSHGAIAAQLPGAEGGRAPLPPLAVLARGDVAASLAPMCTDLFDVSRLTPPETVLRHGGGLILIEQGMPGWDQLLLLLAVERPGSAVIVVSDQLPAHMVRALMKIEASDILPSSARAGDIAGAFERLCETRAAEGEKAPPQTSVCWAFRGAVGGAGVSTLAIESAFALARIVGPGKVCLVDLNLADGMTASFLEAVPKLDLKALSAAPERLDARLMAAWCWQHEDGVSIIASPRDPDADALATEAAILRLLDVACGTFEYVLLDMPRHMMPWTKPVLAAVDQAIVVSELTVPSLHAAADMCRDIDVLRKDGSKARLVLNRMFPKKNFRAGFPVEKAEKSIERTIDVTITSDWDAARTAVNLGKPIADVKPKSPLVADVAGLVRKLAPEEALATLAANHKAKRAKR
ncbi:AAA family ATPase [Hyphomonas sp. NPDC076900]|uniref:AAA family ATPase n=1 Tax=unclassified Hyphomonas TaxID=2630699 RepID=UPI003CFCAE8D